MNFFFALNINSLKCSLTIPKFTNEGKILKNVSLFSSKIYKDTWLIKKYICNEDKYFFYAHIPKKDSDNVFFLNKTDFYEGTEIQVNKLKIFYNIKTNLSFRANLTVINKIKDFSSYQSEYPLEIANKRGSILTTIHSLINKDQHNYIVFKQIYYLPIKKSFLVYLVDLYNQKVLLKKTFYTNSTNILKITNDIQSENCCFYSDEYLGIPIFISYGNKKGISMEHSHPPHIYLQSKNKFTLITNLKKKVKEIVSNSYKKI